MTHPFVATLNTRFGGVLSDGKHKPDGLACALECEAVARGREWSDMPITLPDLRPLNDAAWPDDETRTRNLVPVVLALWDWAEWPEDQKIAWVRTVAVRTVREVLPPMLRAVGLHAVARQCADAADLMTAGATAGAADDAAGAADDAAWAAGAADDAAWAAWDGRAAARDAAGDAGDAARAAAWAARLAEAAAGDGDAGYAARAAAWAAEAAAWAAEAAAGDAGDAVTPSDILALACRIWVECA